MQTNRISERKLEKICILTNIFFNSETLLNVFKLTKVKKNL